jgi:hypothetical protein
MRIRMIALLVAVATAAGVGGQTTYTHFVTAGGSSTSACAELAPCNLWRATQVAFPAGSIVHGAAGEYSHGQLTFNRSGTADAPITFRFDAGARLSGTRDKPAAWIQTPGYRYVYETTDCGLTTCGGVGTVAQRSPANWRPIRVDDRVPPFTVSQGRPFDLLIPPPYKPVATLADVEAQSGTFLASGAQGKVFVHPYHDGPPTSADDLYVAPANWGSVRIEGDHLAFDGLIVEKTSGTGIHVRASANGTVLRNITARAAQVWIEGTNTVVEDLDVSHVIKQGEAGNEDCYDANPDVGVGECWQGEARGDALLIGKQGTTTDYNNIVRRARVHRSWNGVRLDGPNILEDSTLWGFPNHTLQASGLGVVLRHNVLLNGQDSLYMEGNAFDQLRVEGNVFLNGVLIWASRDGRPVGAAPTSWRFTRNIAPSLVLDDRTFPPATTECNAWIPRSASPPPLLKVTSTTGGPTRTYQTLAQVRAHTTLEARSMELPWTFWTEGRAFRRFITQADPEFDLRDSLEVCGQRAGPR